MNTRPPAPRVRVRTLFDAPPAARRSPWAASVSFTAHLAVVAAVVAVGYRQVVAPEAKPKGSIRYVAVALPPPVPVELLLPPLPAAPEAPKVAEPELELPVVRPEPPKPELAPAPAPTPASAPAPKPVTPPKPEVQVGLFAKAPTAAAATQPPRRVETTGFDSTPAATPDMKLKPTAVTGMFDANDAAARPGTDTPKGVVASTGFDQKATAPTPSRGRALAATGFDAGSSAPAPSQPRGQVKDTGFGAAQPAAPTRTPERRAVTTTPVEVLFKPTPTYTEAAREKRVEGEVVLEVEFHADGSLRVLRVVRGLGYGLDEKAVEAASQIRFKPATESGRAVGFKANVQIVFRLAT